MTRGSSLSNILVVGLLLSAAQCRPAAERPRVTTDSTAATPPTSQPAQPGLGGTSWRLVKFEGGDGTTLTQIVKQLPYVRSYVIRDGHLFLSLMADGGIYEFEPASP